jgi:hyaluronan synthase
VTNSVPEATFAPRGLVAGLALIPLTGGVLWGVHHAASLTLAFTGRGNPLAFTWAVGFLLLWWIGLSWLERPTTTTPRQQRRIDQLTVTVQVPVWNEDPRLLRGCLASLFGQTRLPDRIAVVDDGSTNDLSGERHWFLQAAQDLGIQASWVKTENRGKRYAQMEALAGDDADIFVTLDSDSVLDRRALEEGLKPFADPKVQSVAGMVAVWNNRANLLTRLTCMLYTPFTRGFRSAQSVMGRVMVNSGTLAFYRGGVIRRYAGSYERETFFGRPVQMNDDSMLTFYALLAGKAVHQPTAVAYTVVPERFGHYLRQQLRWMRGTFVRTWWWFRYMPLRDATFWMPLTELFAIVLSAIVIVTLAASSAEVRGPVGQLLLTSLAVDLGVNWMLGLRYLVIRRTDETLGFQLCLVAAAPIAGMWRVLILRPLIFYAMATCWKTGWGTRQQVEVAGATPRHTGRYRWRSDPWTAAAAAGITGCLAVALHQL